MPDTRRVVIDVAAFLRTPPESCARRLAARQLAAHGARLARVAALHGVAPLVHTALDARDAFVLAPRVREQLRAAHEHAALRARVVRRFAARVVFELRDAHISAVLLKGAALAPIAYASPALRPVTDLDLLVAPHAAMDAERVLEELGLTRARGDPARYAPHHGPPFVGGPLPLEMHVALAPDAAGLRAADVIARALSRDLLGGAPTLVPCPIDMALHLALHAGRAHRFDVRLLHLVDVRAVMAGQYGALELDVLAARARATGLLAPLRCLLRLARDLVAAPLPGALHAALGHDACDDAVVRAARELVLAARTHGARESLTARIARRVRRAIGDTPAERARRTVADWIDSHDAAGPAGAETLLQHAG